MRKTENLHTILTKVLRHNGLEPKILEQKVFELWREHLGVPFGTKTVPVSLSDGVLKIYTEYPSYKAELLFRKQGIIADLNAALEQPILTDLRIELRPVHPSRAVVPEQPQSRREPPKSSENPDTGLNSEALEQIEQTLASLTDERLKKSLRQLFTTQSEK